MTSAPHPDAGSRAVYRAVSRLISRPTRCGISHQIPCTSRAASRAGSRRKFYATFCAHSTYLGVFQIILANKQRICATSCRRALPSASPIFRHFPTKKAPRRELVRDTVKRPKRQERGSGTQDGTDVFRALLCKVTATLCASLCRSALSRLKAKVAL